MKPDSTIHTRSKEALILDLEQRVTDLEVLVSTPRGIDTALPHLRNLYLDVRLGKLGNAPQDVSLWKLAMLSLTRLVCLELGRAVRDPFVWRWFLAATIRYAGAGHDVESTLTHIKKVAREVLEIQNMRVLDIGDAACAKVVTTGNK